MKKHEAFSVTKAREEAAKLQKVARADDQEALILWHCAHSDELDWHLPVEALHRESIDGNGIVQPGVPCPLCCLKLLAKQVTRERRIAARK
jgi:hypothetical protein